MFTVTQLILHAVGDYVLQSDWMANEKTKRSLPCLVHVLFYTALFITVTQSPLALAVIGGSHFLIDRFRLAKYICYAKNFLAPRSHWYPWKKCAATGYSEDRPAWLAVWLLIITDNLLHVTINALAVTYF